MSCPPNVPGYPYTTCNSSEPSCSLPCLPFEGNTTATCNAQNKWIVNSSCAQTICTSPVCNIPSFPDTVACTSSTRLLTCSGRLQRLPQGMSPDLTYLDITGSPSEPTIWNSGVFEHLKSFSTLRASHVSALNLSDLTTAAPFRSLTTLYLTHIEPTGSSTLDLQKLPATLTWLLLDASVTPSINLAHLAHLTMLERLELFGPFESITRADKQSELSLSLIEVENFDAAQLRAVAWSFPTTSDFDIKLGEDYPVCHFTGDMRPNVILRQSTTVTIAVQYVDLEFVRWSSSEVPSSLGIPGRPGSFCVEEPSGTTCMCADGSPGSHCPPVRPLTCPGTSNTIEKLQICNNNVDCDDGSDEAGCDYSLKCEPDPLLDGELRVQVTKGGLDVIDEKSLLIGRGVMLGWAAAEGIIKRSMFRFCLLLLASPFGLTCHMAGLDGQTQIVSYFIFWTQMPSQIEASRVLLGAAALHGAPSSQCMTLQHHSRLGSQDTECPLQTWTKPRASRSPYAPM